MHGPLTIQNINRDAGVNNCVRELRDAIERYARASGDTTDFYARLAPRTDHLAATVRGHKQLNSKAS